MKALAALFLALALLPASALADSSYGLAEACKFDIEQYCKDIRKTRIRELKKCLAEHEKGLFPRCQDHYKNAMKY
jgi:hypothetical protein